MKNYYDKIKQKLLNNEISKLANEAVLSFDRKRCSNATLINLVSCFILPIKNIDAVKYYLAKAARENILYRIFRTLIKSIT